MNRKIGKRFFILGLVIFVISCLLQVDLFNDFTNLKPTGLTSIFICPAIGVIGIIFSIREKDKFCIVANLILILLLPLSMFAGHVIGLK
ncbi:hypothetical protein [uncultured Anaerococcus sp.]|uniref:hypothetical protein n=1 Tax=uncultured Anaerococcus sp. TaxID=293428 RepID=UPI002612FFE5|nr:hypothetical protein [uncultured Anaerococcus sp.]